MPEAEVGPEVAAVLARVGLPPEMAARAAGQYSGGSRRKLSLGVALVGGVDAVLLDEPSSGMVRCAQLPGYHRCAGSEATEPALEGRAGSALP